MEQHSYGSCGVDQALEVIVGKWKMQIQFYLFDGTKRFSELQRYIPDITKKMLTAQLRELEEQDIVQRTVYPVVPPKVEYSLTEYGQTLKPIITQIHEWGTAHAEHIRLKREEKQVSG